MHDIAGQACLVIFLVACVFEGHPAVACFGKRAHHAGVEFARLDLPGIQFLLLRLDVGRFKFLAVQVGQVRHELRIEQ